MGARHTLNTRIVGGSILLALVVMGTFGLMIATIDDLGTSSRQAVDSEEVLAVSNRLHRLALDLEASQRGFVITRRERFLQPYRLATREYPGQAHRLERLVRDDPVQLARARRLEAAIRSYQHAWVEPLLAVARRDPAAAARRIATGAGLRLMATIRRGFTSFVAAQQRLSVRRAAHNDDERRRAVLLGGLAIGGSALLILIYSSYLFRLVTVPVRRIAEGARRLSAGDLAAQVPERGVGEIGELARDFNAMARSLDERGRQLRRQNAELQAVLDATLDGILMTDKEGNVLFSNRTIDRFWGEVGLRDEGTIWDRLVRLARRTTTPDAYYELFARIADDPNEVVDEEFTLADTKRTFTGHTAAVKDSSGGIVGRIFSIREVTALRESERLKDEFVATVSHELRTPLTSIVGYTELLLEPDGLSGSQRSHLEAIERNAERLQRLVGDLLFFAQVESGELQLDRQTVDLRALGERAVNTAIPNAVEKGLSLELDAPERVHVEGDRGRVEQLLDNLLSNAVKFTPAGGRVRVRLRRDGDAALLEVSDTGIGIPDEEIDQLFRRFFRATSATTREIQGTGLGLAIAKAIVDAHGGEIAASSSGGGATFSVRLPLAPAGALATSPDAPKVSRRL